MGRSASNKRSKQKTAESPPLLEPEPVRFLRDLRAQRSTRCPVCTWHIKVGEPFAWHPIWKLAVHDEGCYRDELELIDRVKLSLNKKPAGSTIKDENETWLRVVVSERKWINKGGEEYGFEHGAGYITKLYLRPATSAEAAAAEENQREQAAHQSTEARIEEIAKLIRDNGERVAVEELTGGHILERSFDAPYGSAAYFVSDGETVAVVQELSDGPVAWQMPWSEELELELHELEQAFGDWAFFR